MIPRQSPVSAVSYAKEQISSEICTVKKQTLTINTC